MPVVALKVPEYFAYPRSTTGLVVVMLTPKAFCARKLRAMKRPLKLKVIAGIWVVGYYNPTADLFIYASYDKLRRDFDGKPLTDTMVGGMFKSRFNAGLRGR